jgi:hypothetical protein
MAITRKIKQKENLSQFRTWITDSDPVSKYFQLSQLPDTFTAGKNAFLINGSEFLEKDSEVLLEILDSLGNPVFYQPIKNYSEGLARVISIEIYGDTPPGLATLTILGRISVDDQGNIPPEEFQNAYNVKWERKIPVVPNAYNVTPIRLYNRPSASVTEVLNPLRQVSSSILFLTGSTDLFVNGFSSREAILPGDPIPNTYYIVGSYGAFTKQMETAQFTALINSESFTASIQTVINNQLFTMTPGYTSGGINPEFITATFTIAYSGSPSFLVSQYTRSYANLNIKKLSTFTGDIYRVRVHVSTVDSPANSQVIADTELVAPELMITSSTIRGLQKLRTGYFTDQTIATNHWVIGTMTSQSAYNPF